MDNETRDYLELRDHADKLQVELTTLRARHEAVKRAGNALAEIVAQKMDPDAYEVMACVAVWRDKALDAGEEGK